MITVTAKVADRTPIYLKYRSDWGVSCKYVFGWSAARRKAAWWIIFERYGERYEIVRNRIPKQFPSRYDCDCYEEPKGLWTNCAVHGKNGYLRRLHDRVVRWLAAGYMLPDSGLRETR